MLLLPGLEMRFQETVLFFEACPFFKVIGIKL